MASPDMGAMESLPDEQQQQQQQATTTTTTTTSLQSAAPETDQAQVQGHVQAHELPALPHDDAASSSGEDEPVPEKAVVVNEVGDGDSNNDDKPNGKRVLIAVKAAKPMDVDETDAQQAQPQQQDTAKLTDVFQGRLPTWSAMPGFAAPQQAQAQPQQQQPQQQQGTAETSAAPHVAQVDGAPAPSHQAQPQQQPPKADAKPDAKADAKPDLATIMANVAQHFIAMLDEAKSHEVDAAFVTVEAMLAHAKSVRAGNAAPVRVSLPMELRVDIGNAVKNAQARIANKVAAPKAPSKWAAPPKSILKAKRPLDVSGAATTTTTTTTPTKNKDKDTDFPDTASQTSAFTTKSAPASLPTVAPPKPQLDLASVVASVAATSTMSAATTSTTNKKPKRPQPNLAQAVPAQFLPATRDAPDVIKLRVADQIILTVVPDSLTRFDRGGYTFWATARVTNDPAKPPANVTIGTRGVVTTPSGDRVFRYAVTGPRITPIAFTTPMPLTDFARRQGAGRY